MSASLKLGTDGKWGVKAGSLLAYSDAGGKNKPLPFDFTRASSATVVNESGLVNYTDILGGELSPPASDITQWSTVSEATQSGTSFIMPSGGYIFENISITSGTGEWVIEGSGDVKYRSNTADAYVTVTLPATVYPAFGSTNARIQLANSSGSDVTISNISVKQVKDNVPRIDYTGGGDPHLLLEPQRINLVTYSEVYGAGTYFSGSDGSTIDNTTSTSPSGDANATQVTSTGVGKIQSGGLGLTQNTDYVLSFYAKNVDATLVQSRVYVTGGSGGSNLTAVDYTSQLSTTEWTRITHSFNTGTNTTIYVYLSNALNSGGTIQLWGAQLEAGSYATSYIPTSGTTVTRVAETCSQTGIGNSINSEEGVLFVEMAALSDDETFRYVSLTDGTGSNCIRLYYTTTSNSITYQVRFGGSLEVLSTVAVSDITNFNKIAVKWKLNDFAMWIGGVEVATDTSGQTPLGMNRLGFDSSGGGGPLYGKVKQLQVFKTALTDAELAALTTL